MLTSAKKELESQISELEDQYEALSARAREMETELSSKTHKLELLEGVSRTSQSVSNDR
jgi:prefoldin subunit 5